MSDWVKLQVFLRRPCVPTLLLWVLACEMLRNFAPISWFYLEKTVFSHMKTSNCHESACEPRKWQKTRHQIETGQKFWSEMIIISIARKCVHLSYPQIWIVSLTNIRADDWNTAKLEPMGYALDHWPAQQVRFPPTIDRFPCTKFSTTQFGQSPNVAFKSKWTGSGKSAPSLLFKFLRTPAQVFPLENFFLVTSLYYTNYIHILFVFLFIWTRFLSVSIAV